MTKQQQDKYIVRFPDGLRDRIKVAAARNERSMNAEIVATLEKQYPPDDSLKDLLVLLIEKIDDPSQKEECIEIFNEIKRLTSSDEYSEPTKEHILMASMALMREHRLSEKNASATE